MRTTVYLRHKFILFGKDYYANALRILSTTRKCADPVNLRLFNKLVELRICRRPFQ